MNQDRDDFPTLVRVVENALPSAHLAKDNGIHRLQMTGVGSEIDLNLLALLVAPRGLVTEVVLHVAAGLAEIRIVLIAEFVEEDLEGFLEEIRQDVQAAAVSHAKNDLLHAGPWRPEQDL